MKHAFMFFVAVILAEVTALGQQPQRNRPQPGASQANPAQSRTASVIVNNTFQTSASELNLKGKVKAIRETTCKAEMKNGAIIKSGDCQSSVLWTFDPSGNRISTLFTKPDGTFNGYHEMSYSKPGQLIQLNSFYYAKNRLSEKTTYDYNGHGYLMRTTTYDSAGQIIRRYVYTYDMDYRANKYIRRTDSAFTRDWSTHQLTKTSPSDYTEYSFDTAGNMISQYRSMSPLYTLYTYRYNDQRQKIFEMDQEKRLRYGAEIMDTVYTLAIEYDAKGNISRTTGMGTLSRELQYTYDTKGNWIRLVMQNTDPISEQRTSFVIDREVEYY